MSKEPEVLFVDINPENPVTKIQSLCMECGENGTTSFLLTTIPHFRELIISSFECPACHTKNNTIQFGGSIQPRGINIKCQILNARDMNRQVVKGDSAIIKIPELELEIPQETQQGTLNTVEGVIRQVADNLEQLQPVRRIQVPEQAAAIDAYIARLMEYAEGKKTPFLIEVDDPTGNSYVEDLCAPEPDPQLTTTHYERTDEQNAALGFYRNEDGTLVETKDEIDEWRKLKENPEDKKSEQPFHKDWYHEGEDASAIGRPINPADVREVLSFPSHCFSCHEPGDERMVRLEIPYFKEIVIMAFSCDKCGYRNNSVKAGGSIADHGKKLTLKVKTREDLCRDLLKSETAGLSIPEIDLVVEPGSLGGRFTTVEGIIQQVRDELKNNAFLIGDSASHRDKNQWQKFIDELTACVELRREFTLVLDDPIANSYILSLTAPEPDPQLQEETYTRTAEQDADLGLDQMNTENYLPEQQATSSDETSETKQEPSSAN